MGRKAPPGGKVERRVIAGIPVRFVYYPRSKSVEAEPDEDALSRASVESVLRFWATVGEWADKVRAVGHDVGPMEVRSTEFFDGRLIVHTRDRDDSPFVLVIAKCPVFVVAGWTWGRDAKQQKYWNRRAPRPAYFVPRSALAHTDSLWAHLPF